MLLKYGFHGPSLISYDMMISCCPTISDDSVSKKTLVIISVSIVTGIAIMVCVAMVLLRTKKNPPGIWYSRSHHRESIVGKAF